MLRFANICVGSNNNNDKTDRFTPCITPCAIARGNNDTICTCVVYRESRPYQSFKLSCSIQHVQLFTAKTFCTVHVFLAFYHSMWCGAKSVGQTSKISESVDRPLSPA